MNARLEYQIIAGALEARREHERHHWRGPIEQLTRSDPSQMRQRLPYPGGEIGHPAQLPPPKLATVPPIP